MIDDREVLESIASDMYANSSVDWLLKRLRKSVNAVQLNALRTLVLKLPFNESQLEKLRRMLAEKSRRNCRRFDRC